MIRTGIPYSKFFQNSKIHSTFLDVLIWNFIFIKLRNSCNWAYGLDKFVSIRLKSLLLFYANKQIILHESWCKLNDTKDIRAWCLQVTTTNILKLAKKKKEDN